jgi:hypothetical protein
MGVIAGRQVRSTVFAFTYPAIHRERSYLMDARA